MLSVEAVFDVVTHIDLVDHLVCVLLEGRREDHDLVVLGHVCDELHAARADQEEAVLAVVYVVDESFIQIEHEGVDGVALLL